MESKIFLDTNVVIDYLEVTRKRHEVASAAMLKIFQQNWQVVISEDMLTTIYYVAKSKAKVLRFFQIVEEEWEILCFDKEVRKKAYEMALKSGGDFEDIIQCIAAKQVGCEMLLTSDRTFYDCGLEVVGYEEILRW